MQPAVVAGLAKRLQAWTTTIRTTIARYLKQAGSRQPDLEAALVFALIEGVSQHYVLDPRRYPLKEVADLIISLFARHSRVR